MPRPTLQTIAERVGVSRMTVSNAFSRPDQLSAELRDRILAAADELGYVGPDPAGRALARGSCGAVGVMLTESPGDAFGDEVATTFLGAIANELGPTGLALTLLSASAQGAIVPARDVPMDGALVYSCAASSTATDWLLRRKLPLVFVDQEPVAGIPSVNIDDRGGARAAAQHLVDLGHRRMGIVCTSRAGPHGLVADPLSAELGHVSRQRLLGWLDVMRGAQADVSVVLIPRIDRSSGAAAARQLLALEPRPTAILCFSDAIAEGVLQAAQQVGLAVPAQLSVVGFDDQVLARDTQPPLTTVRQDIAAKGRVAAATLTAAMQRHRRGPAERARHVVLPTELIIRGTTAPPG